MASAVPAVEADSIPVTTQPLGPRDVAVFERDGFVILPGFFSAEEIRPLAESCIADPSIGGRLRAVADSSGNAQEVLGWSAFSDDYLGIVPRLARLIDGAEALLGAPCYHWHSKLSMKAPHTAGRWDWHQDYPYWYEEGCLRPDMLTCMIAIDRITEGNGCVKLVKGSHHLGRINHVQVGEATGCDPVRLELAKKILETVPVELEPGDACFFHSNVLHASGPNTTDNPRTILHCSYNTIENSPFIEQGQDHHRYKPFQKVADDALAAHAFKGIYENHPFWAPPGENGRNGYGYKVVSRR